MFSCQQNVMATTSNTADGFVDFFEKKIGDILSATTGLPLPKVTD